PRHFRVSSAGPSVVDSASDPVAESGVQFLFAPARFGRLGSGVLCHSAVTIETLMKTISIVTPCRNEESNVNEIYECVRSEMEKVGKYKYEHIFIDNGSKDNTVALLKRIAVSDHNVKIIVNARDFGQIRSPLHALFQTQGDAVIGIVADLQDPP